MLKKWSTRMLLLVVMMLLALFVAACSPAEEAAPTEAPAVEEEAEDADVEEAEAAEEEAEATEAAEEEAEDAEETAEEATEQAAAPANSAAGITELPEGCMVVVLDNGSGRSVLNIGRTQPSLTAPTSRSYRIGDAYSVAQIVENEDGLWYELRQNNRTQGFVLAEQVGLGEGCE